MISACASIRAHGSGRRFFYSTCIFLVQRRPPLLDELGLAAKSGAHVLAELRIRAAERLQPVREDALAHVRLDEVPNFCAQPRKYRGGNFTAAAMPYQVAISNHGSASATAGMTGGTGWRLGVVILNPHSLFLIAACLGGLCAKKFAVILSAYQIGERRPRTRGEPARSACRHQNVEFTRARSASHGWALCGFGLHFSLCSVR